MRFVVPPYQNFYKRYTIEYYNNNTNKSIKIYGKLIKLDIYIKIVRTRALPYIVCLLSRSVDLDILPFVADWP